MPLKDTLHPLVVQTRAAKRYLRRLIQPASHPPIGREPAFDPETRDWFMNRITNCVSYLEYGAGASTLLAADAGVPSLSVESDGAYAQAVRDALPAGAKSQVVAIDIGKTEDWGAPVWTFATRGAVSRWKKYPLAGPDMYGSLPHFPDLILVDGRFRKACALSMAREAQQQETETSILFDDYALREYYWSIESCLGTPERVGRCALFHISPTNPLQGLDNALAKAISDFR